MPSAENGLIQYEAGQSHVAMAALTDSGDHQEFRSGDPLWSQKSGYTPTVRPNGLVTGGEITIDNAAVSNIVDITASTCYLAGVLTSVIAGSVTAARGADAAHQYIINSVIITAAGAYDVLTGTGAAGAFSATRGAAGGPPLITVGCIEVGQVKYTTHAAAAVDADEIFQTVGTHRERYDYPNFTINHLPGKNDDPNGGSVTMDTVLPLDHVGPTAKGIYAEYYEPVFANAQNAENFIPPETSHSVSSKQVYGKTIGAKSSSLGQGSFTVYPGDGVTDTLIGLKDEILIFKFFPDENKDPYIVCQGALGVSRSFPAADNIACACTISAEVAAVEVSA